MLYFKNPYLNSVFAEVYIILVAITIQHVGKPDTPDNFFTPIAALSLFVLSAAVMGFLFIAPALQLYLEGQKNQAVTFFMKTVSSFAIFTIIIWLILSQTT
ncbi:MAG: hypothetical protein R3B41_02720 [Candidatus Doudnabacteria bacterium]